ncbi:OmpA family protein [Thiomonas sp.]|jgi:peptidoglycan-associated lipoprotein|uniref:OmpA family protein n=1 Tax=Thiomonas sp. TaxID=2047785 RepID=UPI00260DB9CA|nr:OmpA family protein [Thiomonas sp.]
MKRHLLSTVPAALALAVLGTLGGCASSSKPTAPVQSAAPAPANHAAQSSVAAVQAPAEENLGPAPNVPRSVFFAFDKYNVENKYRPVIEDNSQYLIAHPAAHVQLQGNTDARGSREYNLALGQKRADAVMNAMELLGAKPAQMEAISFGKEKPKAMGTTAADYAENRRVDIVYQR